jgi:hypothetical protein
MSQTSRDLRRHPATRDLASWVITSVSFGQFALAARCSVAFTRYYKRVVDIYYSDSHCALRSQKTRLEGGFSVPGVTGFTLFLLYVESSLRYVAFKSA